jgi:hypothetical protein
MIAQALLTRILAYTLAAAVLACGGLTLWAKAQGLRADLATERADSAVKDAQELREANGKLSATLEVQTDLERQRYRQYQALRKDYEKRNSRIAGASDDGCLDRLVPVSLREQPADASAESAPIP